MRAIENSSEYVPKDAEVKYFKNLPDENLSELDIQVQDSVTLPTFNESRIVDISFFFTQMDVFQTHNQQCTGKKMKFFKEKRNGF
ncbi:hypothetical protein RN001_001522 [Aquatica leii]|uniref:Uncharacterized protein n=1 Tax=Aquatica leii TaxID=1421715 RepID=A0AAN7PLA9_9COLE|nr:hypothetical protein RN001_001522 [Aquatica leii]